MVRSRYWKITSDEISEFNYDESKLLNWEIKGIREPDSEAHFIGLFQYRNGTPFDYESIKGICYFHNNIIFMFVMCFQRFKFNFIDNILRYFM